MSCSKYDFRTSDSPDLQSGCSEPTELIALSLEVSNNEHLSVIAVQIYFQYLICQTFFYLFSASTSPTIKRLPATKIKSPDFELLNALS
jgi:hypothetical protein